MNKEQSKTEQNIFKLRNQAEQEGHFANAKSLFKNYSSHKTLSVRFYWDKLRSRF